MGLLNLTRKMSIDYTKYSAEKFRQASGNRDKVIGLLRELDTDVCEVVSEAVLLAMKQVVEQLNGQGHQMKMNPELMSIGETDFCERHGQPPNCGFRLCSDLVISSGYQGIHDAQGLQDDEDDPDA